LAEVEFSLPAEIRESLSQLAQNCGTTLFSPLLAAYVILLSRYSGQKDFAIGVPFANREGPEFESQVGFYVNTLVLRSRLAGLAERESVASLVKAIRDEWLGALEQSDLPLEKLVEALHPERAAGRNPLFQALMFWNTRPDKRADRKFPGLFHELRLSVRDHNPGSQVDLTLTLTLNDGDAIAGHLAYDSRRFERSTVERMAANLVEIARSFGSDGSIPLDEVPCPAAAEREWLARLSKSDTTAPVESTVSEEFERIARERPDTIAVVAGGLEITYGELHRRADAFGVRLLKAGVGQGSVVGLLLERSPLMLIALLGTLRIGAAYLPLSTDLPTARIRSMVADAGAAAVVVEPGGPVTGPLGTAQIVVIDTTASDHAEAIPVEYPIPCDLAYLIFTSGSTGSPKAVMVEHRQLTTFFAAMDRAVGPPGNAPWLAATSFGFDISILELLWTLSRGARVVLAEVEKPGPPRRTRTAEKVDLSLFFFGAGGDRPAPATYRMLLDAAQFADRSGFSAVWTPERHFHRFGGAYPNPSVTAAAIAAVTRRIAIRAGSVVLPLHDPLRVAEEWAVVDNISNGRVALSFASGWHSRDFVLAPSKWNRRKENLAGDIDVVRRLWRGEAIARTTPEGGAVDIRSLPRPVQPELPVWLTAAGSRETFRQAAEIGASVLTHLLGQSLDELSSKVEEYRAAWRARGRPGDGYVTLMLHTYVGLETKAARDLVREPLRQYLATALDLAGWLTGALDLPDRAEDSSALVERALDRFLEAGALIGDAHSCRETIERARCAGIDEIACLVDFGLADETVLQGLERLAQLHSRQHVRPARPPAEPLPVLLQRHQIANFQCTPSLAAALLDDPLAVTALGNLDRLIVGGEPLPSTLAARLARCTRTVYNAYGPTETTIWSTIHRVHRNEDGPFVPLGQPIAGTEVYVTDARLRLVPQGARGELLISGAGLSRGYAGRPDLTAERFVPNPFSTSPGERLYRTGDRVQRDAAGSLRFLGRTDDQVKLRGFRIEPGEIRAAINQHHRVRDSFVVLDDASGPRLVAWVVPVRNGHNGASSGHLTAPGLLAFLQERLPHYMVPAEVSFIDALPLNRNGKVDRGALRRPAEHSARIHVEPQGPTQLLLARVFREVLGVTQVGAHDNFFQLGGQSLLAMQAMFRIRRETGLTLPLQSLFEAQSVAELAQLIDTVRWIPARPMSESERRSRGFEEVRL
jgi:natural product biosynthesis luciferase-like monooxygenase protein